MFGHARRARPTPATSVVARFSRRAPCLPRRRPWRPAASAPTRRRRRIPSGTTLKVSDFAALGTNNGVALVTLSGAQLAVVRLSATSYVVLSRVCPHQGGIVNQNGVELPLSQPRRAVHAHGPMGRRAANQQPALLHDVVRRDNGSPHDQLARGTWRRRVVDPKFTPPNLAGVIRALPPRHHRVRASRLALPVSRPRARNAAAYRDARLPVDARVRDLVGRMTLDEKFWQLFMIPGDLDDPSFDYSNGVFGLQISAKPTTGRRRARARRADQRHPEIFRRANAARHSDHSVRRERCTD